MKKIFEQLRMLGVRKLIYRRSIKELQVYFPGLYPQLSKGTLVERAKEIGARLITYESVDVDVECGLFTFAGVECFFVDGFDHVHVALAENDQVKITLA